MTKRYNPELESDYDWYNGNSDYYPVMKENKNGKYVTYESHNVTPKQLYNVVKKNKKLKEKIAILEEKLKNL